MAGEYYRWLARDVKPVEHRELTPAEKRKNWWYYYKYHVLIGLVLTAIGINLICSYFGIGQTKPDYALAYVGDVSLSDQAVEALQAAFAELGRDENGDGEIYVAVNQYVRHSTGDSDTFYYAQAAAAQLIGDITDCDSFFFLLSDPEGFQREMHVLCNWDGSLPADEDGKLGDKVRLLADCPALGELPEELETLYLGRRGFWTEKTVEHLEGCQELWNSLWNR